MSHFLFIVISNDVMLHKYFNGVNYQKILSKVLQKSPDAATSAA